MDITHFTDENKEVCKFCQNRKTHLSSCCGHCEECIERCNEIYGNATRCYLCSNKLKGCCKAKCDFCSKITCRNCEVRKKIKSPYSDSMCHISNHICLHCDSTKFRCHKCFHVINNENLNIVNCECESKICNECINIIKISTCWCCMKLKCERCIPEYEHKPSYAGFKLEEYPPNTCCKCRRTVSGKRWD